MTSRSVARTSPFSFPSIRVGTVKDSLPVTSASGPSDTRTSCHAFPFTAFTSAIRHTSWPSAADTPSAGKT